MPLSAWNIQWLNHNSQRSYPLADWGPATDQSGTITLPDSFILALYFPVSASVAISPDKFYVQSLSIYGSGYSVGIGYNDGTANPPLVASVNISAAQHQEYLSYALAGAGNFDDSVGKIAIGKLDDIADLPAGDYTFDPESAPLDTDAIRPIIQGISGLRVVNGSDVSERIYGDVELVAGSNMRLVVNEVAGQPTQIVFSAIEGEGLNEACDCDESTEGPSVRFINGIPPLPNGNFRMVGNKCMELEPIPNGLQFSDICSEPCCGCEELEALTRQIDRFADGRATLQNFASNLGSEVTQMNQVVLASQLADHGCVEC